MRVLLPSHARATLEEGARLLDNPPVRVDVRDPEWLRREAELLARARSGDRAAFGELYRVFAQPLFTQCLLPRLGDRAAAEDALAETFRTLLEHLDAFEPQGKSVWFWLARIAVNKANDTHRNYSRRGRAMSSYESLLGLALPAP